MLNYSNKDAVGVIFDVNEGGTDDAVHFEDSTLGDFGKNKRLWVSWPRIDTH